MKFIKSDMPVLLISCIILLFIVISLNDSYGQTADNKALIVIDIQENLVNQNSKIHIDTSGIDLFFQNLNTSITQFDNNKDLVVYVVNEWTDPFKNLFTGNACKKGGIGVGLDKRLLLVNDKIYSKSKPNALKNKDLLNHLRDNNISEVYVMGLLAEGCVKATIQGLIKENFNVIVIEDALGSKSSNKKSKVLDYLHKNNIKTIKTIDI
ncbi:MAG: cysteine hydrolase [Bacteroidales bacterium]|jgi:nicotinamidase-related amidase|nr:cysteine hydrolase [Bacteroidales bacterium]